MTQLSLATVCLVLSSCWTGWGAPVFTLPDSNTLQKYWYQTGAEISRFILDQARYGEIHSGEAVFIFVTEDFNSDLQVKADTRKKENIPILKLNATRKFFTGIYPYSTMSSTFSPVDVKSRTLPLKITLSVQEWCGMVFTQLNLKNQGYAVQSRSYFESEADKDFILPRAVPEDGLWARLRLDPGSLPAGDFLAIPGTLYHRFTHTPLQAAKARGHWQSPSPNQKVGSEDQVCYIITYPELGRTLKIFFQKDFPFKILKWEETYRGLGRQEPVTTNAELTHTVKSAYWNHHSQKDRKRLEKLGIKPYP